MFYQKVSIKEELPPLGKFVTTIDSENEHRVFRLVDTSEGLMWNMRDADGSNSPNNNNTITHWLKELVAFNLNGIYDMAQKYMKLEAEIDECYLDENGNEREEDIELLVIGEITATHFGFI